MVGIDIGPPRPGRPSSPEYAALAGAGRSRYDEPEPDRTPEAAVMERIERYRGSLLGLAAGDALGTTLEFKYPGTFDPIDDIVGGGPFRLRPGEWTDDTSLALCLAESLIATGGFDPLHQLETFRRWWRDGHLSSTGRCFDIGNTTRSALARYEQTGEPYPGPTDSYSAGNGSIMRLAPAPLRYARNPLEAIARSAESSRTTHGAPECLDACRYLGGLIVGAVNGVPKDELLAESYSPVPGLWQAEPLAPKIAEVAAGSFKVKEPPAIRGSGYVVQSLEAALWAFHRTDNFRDGALLAVNLGDDADTTGAVYGQLAGAYYGEPGIPAAWREQLALRELIEEQARRLLELAEAADRGSRTQTS
jgi:ADP-ribosylglycohydrolase